MLFLIKQTIRHTLLFTALTLFTQIGMIMHHDYSLAPHTFWPSFIHHLTHHIQVITTKIISLEVQDFFVISTARWLFTDKPHYLILALLLLIVYYNLRIQSMKQPAVLIRQPRVPVSRYEQQKKQNTARQLQKLQELPLYKKYKLDIYLNRLLQKDDDEGLAELRQKEKELF